MVSKPLPLICKTYDNVGVLEQITINDMLFIYD